MAVKAKTSVTKPLDSEVKVVVSEVKSEPAKEALSEKPKETKMVTKKSDNKDVIPVEVKTEVKAIEVAEKVQVEKVPASDTKTETVVTPAKQNPTVIPPSQIMTPTQSQSQFLTQRPYMRPTFQPRYSNQRNQYQQRPVLPTEPVITEEVSGIFDMTGTDGRGIVRQGISAGENDILIS